MLGNHDITFCIGSPVNCPKKEHCYRYKEVNRMAPGELFSSATLYKRPCTKENNYLLFIEDEETNYED